MRGKMNVLVIVSANAEWRVVRELLPEAAPQSTPLGESFLLELDSGPVRFFHGGWGKISAAATAQYAIDRYRPDLLLNLGTCGGFEGQIERGTLILAERTLVYDILEQMADPAGAIDHYATRLDLSWLREPYPHPVQRGLLVSGDRDIVVEDIPLLIARYNAVAADWESGAIAWVARKNDLPCLILRGVSDLVGAGGGEAYGNIELFHQRTKAIMDQLIRQLPDWLDRVSLGS
jgi:adenosylhomocysteine nucleosidase